MTVKKKKVRIDTLMVEKGLTPSRARAQALLMAGKVFVDGHRVDKPGTTVDPELPIKITADLPFVGRGGVKLEGALTSFGVTVRGITAVDVGSSTGGFTDCLLKRGASHVYAIDVGRGLIDAGLRADPRVTLLEGRNVRHMTPEDLPEKADLAVVDVSFISLEKVLPVVAGFVRPKALVLALVKPQFEVGRREVGKGGIVKDPAKHAATVERIKAFSSTLGLEPLGVAESPIKGAKGNREFWLCLRLL